MVLLLVLVIMALLSALLTEFAFSTLVDLRLAETFRDSTRAYYLAKGGIRAGQMILNEDKNGWDSRDELWGRGVPNFPVGEGTIRIDIQDHDGRLSLNALVDKNNNPQSVQKDRLIRLFDTLGLPESEDLVAALIDWLDKDDLEYDQGGALGAESPYYLGLDPPYPGGNGPLRSMEELGLVRGFSPAVLAAIEPHVTLYGDMTVNLNTATPEVISTLYLNAAAPVSLAEAQDIAAAREVEPFQSMDDFQQEFPALWPEFPTSPQLNYRLKTISDYYRIRSQAWINDGTRVVLADVEKKGSKIFSLHVD